MDVIGGQRRNGQSALVERELGFPVIVKTLKGTRRDGVLECEDRSQFEALAGLLESVEAQPDFVMQHSIRANHGRDVQSRCGYAVLFPGRVNGVLMIDNTSHQMGAMQRQWVRSGWFRLHWRRRLRQRERANIPIH